MFVHCNHQVPQFHDHISLETQVLADREVDEHALTSSLPCSDDFECFCLSHRTDLRQRDCPFALRGERGACVEREKQRIEQVTAAHSLMCAAKLWILVQCIHLHCINEGQELYIHVMHSSERCTDYTVPEASGLGSV